MRMGFFISCFLFLDGGGGGGGKVFVSTLEL